jgi:hypothetical protein
MFKSFNSGLLLPTYTNGDPASALEFNRDSIINVSSLLSPFSDVLHDQLSEIKERAKALNSSELVLNISGCGHLTETFFLPALKRVVEQVPELKSKLKLILTDADKHKELAATKNGGGIKKILKEMQVNYEYYPAGSLGTDILQSIKAVFNATPPALHLDLCDWYLQRSAAPIFNEKPACLPDQIHDMRTLGEKSSGRINHIDWVMGTQPFQWLMSQKGQELLARFGSARLVNSYCVESLAVDPDRNGARGQYGLLRRDPLIELKSGFDLGVGIANDCGIHPYFSALLFEMLTKGEAFNSDITNSGVAYARAFRDHRDFEIFDDTAGTWTFSLGPTTHNVIFGKELKATFFGFDAVNEGSARLLVCFGVPAVNNQYEKNSAEVPPYIVYVPDTNSNEPGECHVFDYTSKDLYLGIVVNFLATALNLPDIVRPNYQDKTNDLCLTGVERLAIEKKGQYKIEEYEKYQPGVLPSMIPPYSRSFGVPTVTQPTE